MGTRFLAAEESRASDGYKAMVIASNASDLLVSPAVTGTAASWLKPSLTQAGYDIDNLMGPATRDYSAPTGARWRDVWSAGHGLHAVTAIEPISGIVDQLERGWDEGRARLLHTGTPA
jgi:nitronate monooxygenase